MITWKGSPNFDSNRLPITTVVIHWFGAGTLESANARFQNAANQVSAHYGVSDDMVWQWVQEDKVAYHCGVYAMNQRSIGIEHDATTTKNASEKTYQTSGRLIAEICKRHNIPLDRSHIIGHREVKATQCPGTMDIDRLIAIAKGSTTNTGSTPAAQTELDKLRAERDRNWNLFKAQEELVGKLNQQINDRNADIARLNGQVSSLKTEIAILQQQKEMADQQARKLIPTQKQLEQALLDRDMANKDRIAAQQEATRLRATSYKTASAKVFLDELKRRLFERFM